MFHRLTNSRANRFNGKAPPPDSLIPNQDFVDNVWLRPFRRRGAAKLIGRGPKWRKGSRFDVGDKWRRPLDRNDRARVMVCAEGLERRTKEKHKRDGLLGQSGLGVLRCLVNHFQNRQSGRLDPGYDDIQRVTGFCRQTIANAIKALERAGILEIMRRLERRRVRVWLEEAKQFAVYDEVVQTTNAYMVNYPFPDRATFGDLGAPLLRPEKYRPSESRFSTEPTEILYPKKLDPPTPDLQEALNIARRALGALPAAT
jgi:hypothetical protein